MTDTAYFKQNILPLKNKLFRKALSITGSAVEAQDIVQEAMMRLWSKRADWVNIPNIEGYAMVLVKNQALDKIKKSSYRSESVDSNKAVKTLIHPNLPDEDMERSERVALVWKAIRLLPEKQQELIRLREIEELSYRQIAEEMNITEPQVKIALFRARQNMKKAYLKIKGHDEY